MGRGGFVRVSFSHSRFQPSAFREILGAVFTLLFNSDLNIHSPPLGAMCSGRNPPPAPLGSVLFVLLQLCCAMSPSATHHFSLFGEAGKNLPLFSFCFVFFFPLRKVMEQPH